MAIEDGSDNSNYALKSIRALLDASTLGPDRKLPTERALCEMLNVSRRSVRRALAVLEAEGHVWRRQGSGTFAGPAPVQIIASLDAVAKESNYAEVMALRLQLEPEFAGVAASRATADDVARLRSFVKHVSTSHDADERELWDSALHRTVAEISGNKLYLAIFDLIDRVRQEAAWVEMRERARNTRTNSLYRTQHNALVDAIAAAKPAAAAAAMRAHLLSLSSNLERIAKTERADAP